MTVSTSFEDGVLTISRSYDQPIEEVFTAWVDASKTKEWWGCANTTQVSSEIEPKAGGKYEHAMTITDVGVHPIKGILTTFEPPVRLAYEMQGMRDGETMHVDVQFTSKSGATEVRLTQSVIPAELGGVIQAGWTASLDRLARYFAGERRAA